jgi:hypothetical protein
MTTTNTSLSSVLSAYGSYGGAFSGTGTTVASTSQNQASKASSSSASNSTPLSYQSPAKAAVARQQLNTLQSALGKDIRAALTKAGQHLSGTVDVSLGSDGKLVFSGSDEDKAKLKAALSADKSTPSLTARLVSLAKQAESFDRQSVQSSALTTAARMAGKTSQNLVELYRSLMTTQSSSTAVFSLSDKSSQVAFKGAVSASA